MREDSWAHHYFTVSYPPGDEIAPRGRGEGYLKRKKKLKFTVKFEVTFREENTSGLI